ncbi:hypothetical protein H8R18_00800 [Nanchangia anserum]|uniref:hypothetical protein n=1 Tax=Nanchangia anserum TaxID=2692125 RepID=UPI001883E3E4|nr:hypothetical protein [Nanchangia anserum]QOX81954.1 hypothetical protein H8R18_00800 [Nanchangia anserum]
MPESLLTRARQAYLRHGAPRGVSWSVWVCEAVSAQVGRIEDDLNGGQAFAAEPVRLPRGRLPGQG